MIDTEPVLPNLNIVGDGNEVLHVDKVFVGNTYIEQGGKSRAFFEVQLTTLRETTTPDNLDEMAQRARTYGVLLLGGAYDDKPTLARQVAWQLARERYYATDGAEQAQPLLEWTGTSDFAVLLRDLEQQAEPSVLVMPNVLPQDLGYDLSRLRAASVRGTHVVVATTERTLETWSADAGATACWYTLQPEGMFGADALAMALSTGLDEVRARLPPGALEVDAQFAATLAGVPLAEIAEALRTPGNVEIFVRQLEAARPDQPLDRARIEALVETAASGRNRVEKWFHGVLGPDEQLLALSLALFDDLYDDQYFAAVERLVKHLREERDPRQRAFDYADLEALNGFMTRVEGEAVGTRYTSRWANQRALLLRTAWRTHRRALLGVLPMLAELAADSAPGRGEDDDELYGSDERREQIREAVGSALTEIGLLSRTAVESALLRLAADDDPWVQSVAARAVARWRESGAHQQLFDTLREWQEDARTTGLFATIVEGLKKERANSPMAYIRATIAVAVAYASGYDPPGRLHAGLVELMETLAEDHNALVRDRFGQFTLPVVLSLHLAQMRPQLWRMMKDPGLVPHIGAALAYAYRTNPDEVLETLNELHRATEKRPDTFDPGKLTGRDKMLLTVVHTYGGIDYTDGGPIGADQGFRWLQHILGTERHPQLRTAAVIAVSQQARHRFAEVEPQMKTVLGETTAKERDKVVRILTEIYRKQRASLTGGTVRRRVNGLWLWLWADGPRPRTEVEQALLRWMCDAANPAAQQVAVQAFVSFAEAVDRPAETELNRYRTELRERARREAEARISSTHQRVVQEPGWYTGTFVPWLVTLADDRFARVIRGLLPEALVQRAANRESMDFVLAKLEGERGEPQAVSRHLGAAVVWHGIAWLLLLGAALLVFYVLVKLF
jgi:hypothetical protein